MDKASKALRRSSVRLRALNTGHGDLSMIISDLGEVRSASKALMSSQSTAWQDMVKWASRERNSALQEVFQHFFELNGLWSEIQLEFIASLKKFKHQFEVILEGEQHIDKCQAHLASCEQRELKLRKDLKKAIAKGSEEGRQYEERLVAVKALVKAAQAEVNDKISNQEAMKLIMAKDSLIDLSESYLELAEKATFIFEACRNIASGLPDVVDKDMQDVKYIGSEAAKMSVIKAKEDVHCYKRQKQRMGAPIVMSPPLVMPPATFGTNPPVTTFTALPPYYPEVIPEVIQDLPVEHRYYEVPDESSTLDLRDCTISSNPVQVPVLLPGYDLPPLPHNYCNVDGAVGGGDIPDTRPAPI